MTNADMAGEDAPLPVYLAALPPLASAIAILAGVLVLLGWLLDVDTLKRGVPNFVAMNPVTAITFILSGICLAISSERREHSSGIRTLTASLGVAVVVVGGVKLLGLILGLHPNIDEFLFASKLSGVGQIPNRMAPNTAMNFVFIGSALLTLDLSAKRFSLSQGFALLTGFGALLSATGYAYGVKSFYGVASFIPMALPTTVAFLVLAVGVFFARSHAPLSQMFATRDPRGVLARRLFPTSVLVTLVLGWLRLRGERLGFYEASFGTALFAVTLSAFFIVLVAWSVWAVGKSEEGLAAAHRGLLKSNIELQTSLRQVELILNHARELICSLDEHGRLLTVSAASIEILGYRAEDLIGSAFCDLHSVEDRPKVEAALRGAKSGLTIANFEARCRRKDDSFTPVAWSIQAAPHHHQVFCVGRNIGNREAEISPWQRT